MYEGLKKEQKKLREKFRVFVESLFEFRAPRFRVSPRSPRSPRSPSSPRSPLAQVSPRPPRSPSIEVAEGIEYAEYAEFAEVTEYRGRRGHRVGRGRRVRDTSPRSPSWSRSPSARHGRARTTSPRAALAVDLRAWEGAQVAFRRPCGAVDGEGARGSPRGPERAPRAAGGPGWAYVANVPCRDLAVDASVWALAAR